MTANESALSYIPSAAASLGALRQAASQCKGCDLYKFATQTVSGQGKAKARIMLVGEQPGEKEDLQGEPFVGPAGKLLDTALHEAGIEKEKVYVTNAVKHFKFEERGKRRIHKKPKKVEINACKPWLEAEISFLNPDLIVCLGAPAAASLFEEALKVTQMRGQILSSPYAKHVLITVHPSSILRVTDSDERQVALSQFVDDLRKINSVMKM